MIVTRTPLRVSFAGGGSDLPAWTDQGNTGAVISAAIDRYIYITVGRHWHKNKLRVSYSRMEYVNDLKELKNSLVKSILSMMFIPTGLEISMSVSPPWSCPCPSSAQTGENRNKITTARAIKPNKSSHVNLAIWLIAYLELHHPMN